MYKCINVKAAAIIACPYEFNSNPIDSAKYLAIYIYKHNGPCRSQI